MEGGEEYICKDCHDIFYLSAADKRRYARLEQSLPERCELCRAKHLVRTWQLAQSNLPISNYDSGGCFDGLTLSDLSDIDVWRERSLIVEPQSEEAPDFDARKFRITFTLWTPAWIHSSVTPTTTPPKHAWQCIATPGQVEHPDIIKFSVAERLTGAAWLRTLPEGLALWWIEYAPWVNEYVGAERSLLFYAIAESARRDYRGRILARSYPHYEDLFTAVGFRPTADGRLLELSHTDAWRAVMGYHHVPEDVIDELLKQDQAGTADTAWIVEQIGRGHLKAPFIEAFTRFAHHVSWLDLKRFIVERDSLPINKRTLLRHQLRDAFGALFAKAFYRELLGTEVGYSSDAPIGALIVPYARNRYIRCLSFDSTVSELVHHTLWLDQSESVLIVPKVFSQEDYRTGLVQKTGDSLIRETKTTIPRILAVSEDFEKIDEHSKKAVAQSLVEQGWYLVVLKEMTAKQMRAKLDYLVYSLTPKSHQNSPM